MVHGSVAEDWFEDHAPECADDVKVFKTPIIYFVSGLVVAIIQLCIIAMLKRGRYLASKGDRVASSYLVLPIYFVIVRYLVFIGIVTAILDMSSIGDGVFAISLKWGLYRMCSESVAIFFMQNGIGYHTLVKSMSIGMTWGAISTIVPFVVFNVYGWHWFLGISTCFNVVLLSFYLTLWLAPRDKLHRRPALIPFAKFYAVGLGLFLLMHSLLLLAAEKFPCLTESISVFADVFQPFVIYYALLQDSHFWQGLYVSDEDSGYTAINEPLLGMWELGRETIGAMADTILSLEKQVVPIIPFGNLKIDSSSYCSGGSARVYKGTFGQTQVAIKTLFCIELTPEKVVEFCDEAGLLNALKHENVLLCHGVAVMPPAICLVTEWCSHGSLFDLLHESDFFIRDSSVGTRYSMASVCGVERSIAAYLLEEYINGGDEAELQRRNSHCSSGGSEEPPYQERITIDNHDVETGPVSLSSDATNQQEENEFGSYNLSLIGDKTSSIANSRSRSALSASTASHASNVTKDSNVDSLGRRGSNPPQRQGPSQVNIVLDADNGDVSELDEDMVRRIHASSSKNSLHALTTSNVEKLRSAASVMQSKRMGYGLGPGDIKSVETSRRTLVNEKESVGPYLLNGSSNRNTLGLCLPLALRYKMMKDCCAGVAHLHSKGIMHCDVKSLNFLVSSDFAIKLADLGEARPIRRDVPREISKLMPKNINWTAPEVLVDNGERVCEKADVWSLAVVCSEILSGEIPFDTDQCRQMTMEHFVDAIGNDLRPNLPHTISPVIRSTVHSAWSYNVDHRCSASDMYTDIESFLIDREQRKKKTTSPDLDLSSGSNEGSQSL